MSLHEDALTVLEAWSAPTDAQRAMQQEFVALLNAHEDAPYRSSFPDHLTSGVLILDHTGERVLLNLHRKALRWFHFGGHCEPEDRTLIAVARREGTEESGLSAFRLDPEIAQLDIHTVRFCDARGSVRHFDVRYVAQAPEGADHLLSEESLDVRWFGHEELPELEPAMHDLIAIARMRFA